VLWRTDWPHLNLNGHMPAGGLLVDFVAHIAATPARLADNPMRLHRPRKT
jgi:2-pyrone-4,6-dicarboxylate lactonase